MRVLDDIKLDFNDVLFVPKRSTLKSRKDVDLERTYKFKHSGVTWTGIPIMAANMDGVGTVKMLKALSQYKMVTCLTKFHNAENIANIEHDVHPHLAISTGTSDEDFQRMHEIITEYPSVHFICVDIANGYSEHFGDYIAKVRETYEDKVIIAGNVVTADMTQELILRGADIVKIGIGSGAQCTTRIQTGVGYPQLSAVMECADAAHGLGAHIISDGGCTCPGDVAKAFGAGADFGMLGSMLAGHTEGGGRIIKEIHGINQIYENGQLKHIEKEFVEFYGMSSESAQAAHGGVKSYRASEGRTTKVPYKGEVTKTINEILGGVRSACTYVGAGNLKNLSKCATFIRVNNTHNRSHEQYTVGK